MQNLPWQFVVLTSVAILATAISAVYAHDGIAATASITGIGLLFGQVLNYVKSSKVQEVVERRTEAIESKTEDRFADLKKANHEAATRAAEAAVREAAKVAEALPVVPTAQDIAKAVMVEVKKSNS